MDSIMLEKYTDKIILNFKPKLVKFIKNPSSVDKISSNEGEFYLNLARIIPNFVGPSSTFDSFKNLINYKSKVIYL